MKTLKTFFFAGLLAFLLNPLCAQSGITDLVVSRTAKYTGAATPAQIVANTNDYAPAGMSTASFLRLSTDASRNITGLTGGAAGRFIWIINVGSFNIVLKDESASSTAANRFSLDGDVTLAPEGSLGLWYDGTTTRWQALSSANGGSGVVDTVAVATANGFAGSSSGGNNPILTLTTSITGILKGNGTAISAASSGTDYAPATSGTSLLYGNGSGGFSNATVGTSLSFTGGALSRAALTGDITASADSNATTVGKINGTSLAGLATGLLKNTTTTGVPSIAIAGTDYAAATSGAFILAGNGAGGFTNTDMTYSTPTLSVPDAFVVFSAGSIGLTAGGTNKNVTITPSGTGNSLITFGLAAQAYTYQGLQIVGAVNQRTGFMLDAQGTNNPTFLGRRARDTAGSPSAVQLGDTIGQYAARGYGATGYPAANPGFSLTALENFTDSAAGAQFVMNGTIKGTTTAITLFNSTTASGLVFGAASTSVGRNAPAWGVTGVQEAHVAGTYTDSTSSGTVATAVANSFGIPAFAASSATTFTNAANLYLAGDVANGTNVTLTNSYGLWNAGKTRLDGTAAAGALPSGATTVGTILTMPAQTFTVTGTNTATAFQASYHGAPTFTDASVGTITDAFNSVFVAPSAAGGSLVITRSHTLGILDSTSASSSITGGLVVSATFGTTATSVGIGGGNINAGGTGTFGGTLSVTGHTTFEGVTSTGATGTGKLVYDGTPTLVTPVLGAATGTSIVLTGAYTSGAPTTGTAGAWKFGVAVTGVTSTFVSTNYIQLDVGGTLYKLATVTSVP